MRAFWHPCLIHVTQENANSIHYLKTWSEYFDAVALGNKTFEVRQNDRDFKEGDILTLQRYCPEKKEYTGEEVSVRITYILQGGSFGVKRGFVVMGIKLINL